MGGCPHSASMRAAKLSCLCAAEGSGIHTQRDALQHIKKCFKLFKNFTHKNKHELYPFLQMGSMIRWTVTIGWFIFYAFFIQKNMSRVVSTKYFPIFQPKQVRRFC